MTTKEKHINMLHGQIEKLNQKPFDLESWKKYTIVLLSSIFGDESQKIKQVEKIEYEYNSWSLRDTTGHSSYLESCKKLGREILQVAIMELEDFSEEHKQRSRQGQIDIDLIIDALNDELTGTQYKALMKLLKTEQLPEEKSRQLHEVFKNLGSETIAAILQGILLHHDFAAALPDQ
jgi:hypothetical protein